MYVDEGEGFPLPDYEGHNVIDLFLVMSLKFIARIIKSNSKIYHYKLRKKRIF